MGIHVSDQAHTVFDPSGKSLVDYIGRTEHLMEDLEDDDMPPVSGYNFAEIIGIKRPNIPGMGVLL